LSGSLVDDPYLREGDAIIVPAENFAAGSISISGAVKMPGNFEYVAGDRIKDLLELSAGLTGLADSSHVNVLIWKGSGYDDAPLNLGDSLVLDQPLPVNSRVIIPTDWSKENNFYVWVTGAVRAPGIYPISRDSTKLTTVVSLAGGFTKWASLPNATLFRIRQQDYRVPSRADSLYYLGRATGLSWEDVSYATAEILLRRNREVASTDFVSLFVEKDESYDCTLRSGDSIYVPSSLGAIYVFGQVNRPGYVDYHNGWDYSDYLRAAGGVTEESENGKVKVIKDGTYQWYDAKDAKLEPGDLLFVPRLMIKADLYTWNLWKDIIATVGAVASVAATVILVVRTAAGK
jgi:protein involved in polysaccharide export with SLBB domain